MEARFATPERTLTAPNYRVEFQKLRNFFKMKFYRKILKNLENCLLRKLTGFDYSYMEARIAKPGKTLTTSHY